MSHAQINVIVMFYFAGVGIAADGEIKRVSRSSTSFVETERQTDGRTDRQTDRKTDRQRDTGGGRLDMQAERQTYIHTDRQTERQTNSQTDRQTDR